MPVASVCLCQGAAEGTFLWRAGAGSPAQGWWTSLFWLFTGMTLLPPRQRLAALRAGEGSSLPAASIGSRSLMGMRWEQE